MASAGMNKDIDPQLLKDGVYLNAINAQLHNHEGNMPFIQNEPANFRCLTTSLTVIGVIKLSTGKFAIFSTDDFNSEVGIFDDQLCTYTKIANSTCLGFKKTNLIKGVSKKNFDCTESVYFTDNLNPRRRLNLDNPPFKFTIKDDDCETKEYTDDLDCDELLIDKKISYPKISIELGTDGFLKNGSYQVAVAYSVNSQVATDWMGVTLPIKHFSHENLGKSLEVTIDNLDREFDEYTLAVIHTIDGSTAVDRVGVYSTAQNKVVVTNVGKTALNNSLMTLDEIVIKRPVYDLAEDVVATSQYLLWANPSTKKELNYQKTALDIKTKWVAYKVPKDYYRKGGTLVGYMRDEVYSFGIQWLYCTGDWSPAYHIPGRAPKGRENVQVAGQDVYEMTGGVCDEEELPFHFQVFNSAKLTRRFSVPGDFCDPSLLAEGEMAYWQSSEVYPDNEDLFSDLKCTPIRHHKFPDSSVIHIHDNDVGNDNGVIIVGVRFENIKPPTDSCIVGYRIVRGDRLGNRSIVAKGMLFNTGNYTDNGLASKYPNYPYNDLRADAFLSSTQTTFNGTEHNYNAIGAFDNDKYTFHSPGTSFNKPFLGTELKLETEEVGRVAGRFEEVYKHPKYKFITNFSFGIAAAIGAAAGVIAIKGKKCVTAGTIPGGAAGAPMPFSYATSCETELTGKIGVPGAIIPIPNFVGIAIAFGYYFAMGLQTVINTVKLLSNWQQFAYQYDSHGFYSGYTTVPVGNKRRRINYSQYLIPGMQDINGFRFNNFNRESSVYLELNSPLRKTQNQDTTRNTISGFGLCNNPTQVFNSTAASYYASIKKKFANQYGQLDSISYFDTGIVNDINTELETLTSQDIFGGDTYISRFTEKRKLTYFLLWPFDVPDGYEWDYRKHANIPYPRYWIDGSEYDFGEMANLKLPSSKHNLDCYRPTKGLFIVKDRYFYLSNNGVVDYYAESEYNPDYRDWEDSIEGRHYDWHSYTNLRDMFRSDKIQFDNKFLFDKVYLKQLNENFIPKQTREFDPDSNCLVRYDNRVIYSLPAQKEQIRDNWVIYPGLNYFDFTETGKLTSIKSFDRDRLLFLFDKASPYVTLGVDTLQTDQGTKVLLGDGGLFAQRPQKLLDVEYGYGSSQSKFCWTSTQFGGFYVSQTSGSVFLFDGQRINEVSSNGMDKWFKANLPSHLLKDYPHFLHNDNTVIGVGVISVFDPTYKTYYLIKKDFKVKDQWKSITTYDAEKDKWKVRGIPVDFKDPLIFEDASWALSYDPRMQTWVSFHDWHPEFIIQPENHFMTIKDKSIWKHNSRCDLYCNFYDDDFPWEVEQIYNNGQQTSTLSSLEYSLECFEYKENCVDKFHILDENFDEATISNTEQSSGLLQLFPKAKNSMLNDLPIFDSNKVKVEYTKNEQKYRLDSFWDLTKDRGEFSGARLELFRTQPNGYRKVVNRIAIDYSKEKRKKFRHNYGSIILRKSVSGSTNMKLKFTNEKQITSLR